MNGRRLLLLASAIVFVDTMFYAAVVPILPRLSDEFDLSKSAAGVLTGSFAAGVLIGALPSGVLAARIGVKPMVLGGLALMSASSVVFAVAGEVWILDLTRFVQGVASAGTWAGAFAWLVGAAPPEHRGALIGSAMGAAIAGALFGPVLGGLAVAAGRAPTFAGVAVLGLCLYAWAARTPGVPSGPSPSLRALGAALADSRVVAGTWLVVLPALAIGVIDVLVPLRLDELGASGAAIALVFLLAAAVEMVVSPLAGRASDRRGRLAPAIAGVAGTAALTAVLPWPDASLALAAVVVAGSLALGMLWAPAMAMLSDAAEARGLDQAPAFAVTNLAWSIGALAGAAGGARVGEALGDAAAYLTVSALCLLTLAGLVLLVRHRAGEEAVAPALDPEVAARR